MYLGGCHNYMNRTVVLTIVDIFLRRTRLVYFGKGVLKSSHNKLKSEYQENKPTFELSCTVLAGKTSCTLADVSIV